MATDEHGGGIRHEGDHAHEHGDDCGHGSRSHDGHTDYLHDVHWHTKHGNHWDDHVITPPGQQTLASWDWVRQHWPDLAILVGSVVGVIVLLWLFLGLTVFPRAAPLTDESTVDQTNAAVGAFLILAGVVLTMVAFVPALVLTILSSFDLRTAPPRPGARGGLGETIGAAIAAIPDLLKLPAGFGVVLVLLGVILMSATTLASEPGASPTPTPANGESAPPSSPTTVPSVVPTAPPP